MKVKELIEHLQTLEHQDWIVRCSCESGCVTGDIYPLWKTYDASKVYILGGD